jgi:hypothetical protein
MFLQHLDDMASNDAGEKEKLNGMDRIRGAHPLTLSH